MPNLTPGTDNVGIGVISNVVSIDSALLRKTFLLHELSPLAHMYEYLWTAGPALGWILWGVPKKNTSYGPYPHKPAWKERS